MIDKNQLKSDIKTLLDATKSKTNQQDAIDTFADTLADKIADAIKRGIDTALITIALTAPNGPVAGTITLKAEK